MLTTRRLQLLFYFPYVAIWLRLAGLGISCAFFNPIIVMAPACVIGKQPQSFAIPYHAADSKDDDGVYLTPLLRLSLIGAELTGLAYSR